MQILLRRANEVPNHQTHSTATLSKLSPLVFSFTTNFDPSFVDVYVTPIFLDKCFTVGSCKWEIFADGFVGFTCVLVGGHGCQGFVCFLLSFLFFLKTMAEYLLIQQNTVQRCWISYSRSLFFEHNIIALQIRFPIFHAWVEYMLLFVFSLFPVGFRLSFWWVHWGMELCHSFLLCKRGVRALTEDWFFIPDTMIAFFFS